jgi:hypothetical protein
MKKVYLLLFASLVLGLSLYSCTKEDDLLNDGDARDAFLGEWSVSDACSKQTYRSHISLDPDNTSQVTVSNYANLGKRAQAVIAGNSIYIESQDIGNGYTVSGNGRLTGERIAWTSHNFESSGEASDCTATYSQLK